jgi:hypothetical protein
MLALVPMPMPAPATALALKVGRGMGSVTETGVVYTVCPLPALSTDDAYPARSAKFTYDVLSFSSNAFEEGKADMEGVEGVSNGSSSTCAP